MSLKLITPTRSSLLSITGICLILFEAIKAPALTTIMSGSILIKSVTITSLTLFRQILPSYDEVMQDETYWLNPASIEERAADVSKKKVKEIMVKELIKINPGMLVVEAGALMASKKIKQIPVMDSNDDLVGVISFKDITWGFLIKPIK